MSAPAIDKPKVYLYKMEIRNLQLKEDAPSSFKEQADWATKQIAALLKTSRLVEKAIDLSWKGGSFSSKIDSLDIFLTMAQPLSQHFISTMQNKIQEEAVNSDEVECPVTLKTIDDPWFAVQLHDENATPRCRKKIEQIFFANVCPTIPRLTEGPVTGKYDDSWIGAIRTQEAREWLQGNKIDPERVHYISLVTADDNHKHIHIIGGTPPRGPSIRQGYFAN